MTLNKKTKEIRVVQMIDSLDAGGAERIAVNLANLLASEISFSGLIVTRKEGALKQTIEEKVHYIFLNKKRKLDWSGIRKSVIYLRHNSVNVLHAHSTSWFFALILKVFIPRIKIVWHDHFGNSEFLHQRPFLLLKLSSNFFSGIISVNERLQHWAQQLLYSKRVIYLRNFYRKQNENLVFQETILKGESDKRIVCLANLRQQKNHLFLIKIAIEIFRIYPDWTFHLIGDDKNDSYSAEIKSCITKNKLEKSIYVYGSCSDIDNILKQSTIGVLTSLSEGLPIALLEYAFAKLPVVATDVGQISEVIPLQEKASLIPSGDLNGFVLRLKELIENENKRLKCSEHIYQHVLENYSEKVFLNSYLPFINQL